LEWLVLLSIFSSKYRELTDWGITVFCSWVDVISNRRPRLPKTLSCNTSSVTLKGHRKSRIQANSKTVQPVFYNWLPIIALQLFSKSNLIVSKPMMLCQWKLRRVTPKIKFAHCHMCICNTVDGLKSHEWFCWLVLRGGIFVHQSALILLFYSSYKYNFWKKVPIFTFFSMMSFLFSYFSEQTCCWTLAVNIIHVHVPQSLPFNTYLNIHWKYFVLQSVYVF